ncbi:MAG: hypothetical protein H6965_12090 [Chromatiaceae bacterium]|nr:hypothetical protein [Chromatiaceae bacterium]
MKEIAITTFVLFSCFQAVHAGCIGMQSSGDTYGDKTLDCSGELNREINNLVVTKTSEQWTEKYVAADIQVQNVSENTLVVRSMLAMFLDASDIIIGLCSQDTNAILNPGEKKGLRIECTNYRIESAGNSEVASVKLIATPYGDS